MKRKLNLIQISRALVPLMVMTFHLSESINDYYGFEFLFLNRLPLSGGVNYFFALTGFMMYFLYKNKFTKKSEWKPYILNRAIRIYPLYWIVTVFHVTLWIFCSSVWGPLATDTKTTITSLFLIPLPSQNDPYLIVAWSLIYTIFFYIVFSFTFLMKKDTAILFYAAWTLLSVAFYTGLIDLNFFPIHFLFSISSLIFIGGMAVGLLIEKIKLSFKQSVFFSITGLLMFPFMWINYLQEWFYADFDFITGAASFLLIWGLASIDVQKTVKCPKIFSYLGHAAFAIYLTHNTVLDLLMEFSYQAQLFQYIGVSGIMIILTVLMVIVGSITHSFIEKPLVQYLKSIVYRRSKNSAHDQNPQTRTA